MSAIHKQSHRHTVNPLAPLTHFEPQSPAQAIVLIAVMLAVLIGMAALAIDGGGVLFLQRDAQNAADAAAIAGAYSICDTTITDTQRSDDTYPASVFARGRTVATDNGFTTGVDHPGVQGVTVSINYPAAAEELPSGADPNEYVHVRIQAGKPSYFAQVVYQGALGVTVDAIAHCTRSEAPQDLAAVVGLRGCGVCSGTPCDPLVDPLCDPTSNRDDVVDFSGSEIDIVGGYHSNCNCKVMPGGGDTCGEETANTIDGGSCVGTQADNGTICYTVTSPTQPETSAPAVDDPLSTIFPLETWLPGGDMANIASLDLCPQDTVDSTDNGKCYHYLSSASIPSNSNGDMYEGLYVIRTDVGTGNFATSGTIQVGVNGATFITPNGIINFPPVADTGNLFPYIKSGFMLAASYKNAVCTVVIKGPSAQHAEWAGIIYAPHGECTMTMATGVTYGSIVCQKADIEGSSYTLIYDPSKVPYSASTTEVIH